MSESTRLNQQVPPAPEGEETDKPLTAKERKAAKKEELRKRAAEARKKKANRWPPYDGDKKSLPADYVMNSKGKVRKPGSIRYAINTALNGSVEVLGFYRNGKGVAKKIIAILKVQKRLKQYDRDRAFLAELRAAGVRELRELEIR